MATSRLAMRSLNSPITTPPATVKPTRPDSAHDLDRGVVEPRQDRRGDDLVERSERRLAVPEIEHAVDRVDELVEFVRREQHGDAALAADAADDVDRHFLVARIKHDQGLVEQQQLRM